MSMELTTLVVQVKNLFTQRSVMRSQAQLDHNRLEKVQIAIELALKDFDICQYPQNLQHKWGWHPWY